MTSHNERADADEHDECRKDDGPLVGGQHRLMVSRLIDRPFGHEDGIIVALSENERGENDIDDIKLDAAESHDTENPQPADSHRQEGQHGQGESAERELKEEEHDASAGPADIVEVVGELTQHPAVQVFHVDVLHEQRRR